LSIAPPDAKTEIEVLAALGFGPDTLLMSESKLFVDPRFFASLLAELTAKLGTSEAQRTIFQIGLLYGLRDAHRIIGEGPEPMVPGGATVAESPLLAIAFGQPSPGEIPGSIEIPGSWPERFEADVRLGRLGASTQPSCTLSAGYTSGWLSGTFDTDILALEHACSSSGGAECRFSAREVSEWRGEQAPRARALLPNLPFDVFREISRGLVSAETRAVPSSLETDDSTVHVWGPVMVLPFTNCDEALQMVEMLGRNPQTREVRVVVVDLRGEGLDEGFAAAALEQTLETIEAWGAEAIVANVSVLAEAVVSDLEVRHLLLRKDLPEAIAAAFQIANAQRHLL